MTSTELHEPSSAAPTPLEDLSVGKSQRSSREWLEAYAFLGLLLLVFAFFSLWPRTADTFLSQANLQILIGGSTVLAIVALGALVPLICGEWDLSVGAITGLSSIYVASVLGSGASIGVAILVGIAVGGAVGVVNAVLVTRLHVNAVITTLGVSIIVAGVITLQTHGRGLSGNYPDAFIAFGTQNWLGLPRSAWALAAVASALYFLLYHTPYGRHQHAMGASRAAAVLVGVRTTVVLARSFVVGGVLCGLAGVLLVARSGGADPRVGESLTLPALAAAFLSAAAIRPGSYNLGGTVVAIYFLATINSGLSLAGAPDFAGKFVNGGALIIGVALAVRLGQTHRKM